MLGWLDSHPDAPVYAVSARDEQLVSIPIHVDAPNRRTRVTWEFAVEDNDIGFGVAFFPAGAPDNNTQLQPRVRMRKDSSCTVVTGSGTLILTLDNTYSRLRSKKVQIWHKVDHLTDSDAAVGTPAAAGGADPVMVDTPYGVGELLEERADSGQFVVRLPYGTAYLQAGIVRITSTPAQAQSANARVLHGIDLFFQNRFADAEAYFGTERNREPIFALAHACVAFIRGAMSWSRSDIETAGHRLHHVKNLCAALVPQESAWSSLSSMVSGSAKPMSPLQLEATLVTAEASLMQAILYATDESVMSFVKAGLVIRSGWKMYEQCDKALGGLGSTLGKPERNEDLIASCLEGHDRSVIGGVLYGMGSFNAFLSVLPAILLKVIEIFGFPSDRDLGLAQLEACIDAGGVRAPLAALSLLAMDVLLPSFFATDAAYHLPRARPVLDRMLAKYPNAAVFLWLEGRALRMEARLSEAVAALRKCHDCQDEWDQLKHLCRYEIGWCQYFALNWTEGIADFAALEEANEWSRSFYAYEQAVGHFELGNIEEANRIIARVTTHRSRLRPGGKVLSVEQFVYRRAELALRGVPLVLPGFESVYLFNGFAQMPEPQLRQSLAAVQRTLLKFAKDAATNPDAPLGSSGTNAAAQAAARNVGHDAVAVTLLILGAVLGSLHYLQSAKACYNWILEHQDDLIEEKYTLPYAMYELGVLAGPDGGAMFKAARDYSPDYNFKIRLHIRLHMGTDCIRRGTFPNLQDLETAASTK